MKFLRQNWFRHKRLGLKWRRPRGSQSKLRKRKKGKGAVPKIGYKKPEHLRGLVPYKGTYVRAHYIRSPKEIMDDMEYIIVASSIGLKKLHQIYLICKEKGIKIVNYKKLNRLWERLKELKRKAEKEKAETGEVRGGGEARQEAAEMKMEDGSQATEQPNEGQAAEQGSKAGQEGSGKEDSKARGEAEGVDEA